jgi:hypothetical protein
MLTQLKKIQEKKIQTKNIGLKKEDKNQANLHEPPKPNLI